jgi:putative MATE family efflux protein
MHSIFAYFEREKDFYRTFIKLGVPVALQNFLAASLGLIDNIMVGQLGDVPIASVGLANQYYFILFLVMQGVGGGTALFVSQFWGKKNLVQIRKVIALGLALSIIFSFLFFLAAVIAPRFIMGIFSADRDVIKLGGVFLSIVAISYMPMCLNFCVAAALRSMREVHIPLQANILGILINTCLNYILIFGKSGFPAMGVAGAAIATVIAQSVALLYICLRAYFKMPVLFHKPAGRLFHTGKRVFSVSKDLIKRFVIQTGTMIGKDLIWVIGISVYMAIYARISTDAAAAVNITSVVRNLSVVLFAGIANASSILVGNSIGAGDRQGAYAYAAKFLKITLFLGVIFGIILILTRYLFLMPYKVSVNVFSGASGVMLVFGIALVFYVYNMVAVMGVMRPGGDNFFCAIMDTIAVWFIGLPLALLTAFVWKFPLMWVFAFISTQEVFKALFLTWRFKSKKWIHNLVHGI